MAYKKAIAERLLTNDMMMGVGWGVFLCCALLVEERLLTNNDKMWRGGGGLIDLASVRSWCGSGLYLRPP